MNWILMLTTILLVLYWLLVLLAWYPNDHQSPDSIEEDRRYAKAFIFGFFGITKED